MFNWLSSKNKSSLEIPDYIPDELKEVYKTALKLYANQMPNRVKKVSQARQQYEAVLFMIQLLENKKDKLKGWRIFDEQTYALAKKGDTEAQKEWARRNMIGEISGSIGKPDYLEARKWFLTAGENGNADSFFWLGYLYSNGNKTIPKDIEKAKYYYSKAAKLGSKDASSALSELQS